MTRRRGPDKTPRPAPRYNKQRNLMNLIQFAVANDGLNSNSEFLDAFLALADQAAERELEHEEFQRLTTLTQEVVKLPFYTSMQAAAWLGMTYDGLMRHVSRTQRIKTFRPGRDLLIVHDELVHFVSS